MALEDKIASANKKSPETSIWIQEQLQLEHELSTQQWYVYNESDFFLKNSQEKKYVKGE